MLPDYDRALLLCLLHSHSVQVFGRLTLLRGTPVCFRQSLHLTFLVCVSRGRCLPCQPASCNGLDLYIHICLYAHACSRLVSAVLFDCGSCVLTFLCACKRVRCFSILLCLSYFLVQDPGGPASFYMHARNKETPLYISSLVLDYIHPQYLLSRTQIFHRKRLTQCLLQTWNLHGVMCWEGQGRQCGSKSNIL